MTETNYAQFPALFERHEGPTISHFDLTGNTAIFELYIDESLSWFVGHFPTQPVLPGVVQVDWAAKLGMSLFAKNWVFERLINIKFKNMIMPNTRLHLQLDCVPDKHTIKFHFYDQDGTCSMGSLKFLAS